MATGKSVKIVPQISNKITINSRNQDISEINNFNNQRHYTKADSGIPYNSKTEANIYQ